MTASTTSGSGLFQAESAADADLHAGAHGRQHRRLGEDLGVGADADLEVLRPQAARLQHRLQRRGLRRARLQRRPGRRRSRPAPRPRTASARDASPLACSSITRSSRLVAKVTPAALMHLQVAWREQVRAQPRRAGRDAVAQQLVQAADAPARQWPHLRGRVGFVEQVAHRREARRQVEHAVVADRDHRRPGRVAGQPGARRPACRRGRRRAGIASGPSRDVGSSSSFLGRWSGRAHRTFTAMMHRWPSRRSQRRRCDAAARSVAEPAVAAQAMRCGGKASARWATRHRRATRIQVSQPAKTYAVLTVVKNSAA